MHMQKKAVKNWHLCFVRVCGHTLFLSQSSREKMKREMWVCTVKVSQVAKSTGCHAEGMTLPQVASSRKVPKGIGPALHCGNTHC